MEHNDAKYAAILEQYRPLLLSATESFFARGAEYGLEREEIGQEAQIALYNALRTYNEEQEGVTFGLYAKICIRNRLVSLLRKAKKASRSDKAATVPVPSERENIKARLDQLRADIVDKLTDIEKAALDGYLAGLTYKEIADRHGCSAKTIDNALWRVKKKVQQQRKDT